MSGFWEEEKEKSRSNNFFKRNKFISPLRHKNIIDVSNFKGCISGHFFNKDKLSQKSTQ